jgi:hypothetical protein
MPVTLVPEFESNVTLNESIVQTAYRFTVAELGVGRLAAAA